ncbi:MAG: ATP-grasp domain-containing protein [Steroidobacteraceae bacterium]
MKLLLTGACGDIADSLCRIAHDVWSDVQVHGAESSGERWPLHNGFAQLHRLPGGSHADYFSALRALQERERYDLIVPVTDAELWTLAQRPRADLPLLAVAAIWLQRCLDKAETPAWLASIGLPALVTTSLAESAQLAMPMIVKPRRGHGSRGLEVVHDSARLQVLRAMHAASEEYLAQQYVGVMGDEFTCCVYRRAATGEMRTIALRREMQGGLTGRATVEHVPVIDALLRRIGEAGDLDGSINVQLRFVASQPWVFEINPRFSSTVMMRHRLGFRDFVWSVEARRNGRSPEAWNAPVGARVFRLARELVIPVAGEDAT